MNEQRWNPSDYERSAAFVFRTSESLVDELAPRPNERILDLGCGTGVHAAAMAARGARVVGMDASPEMITAARASHPGVSFVVGDGQELTYEACFDAVFSNAALHWMPRADDVARGIARALAPGGRLVLEMPEAANVARTIDAVSGAMRAVVGRGFDRARWYFPTLGEHARRLEAAGLRVRWARVFERPSFVADEAGRSGLHVWLRLFANDVLEELGDDAAEVIARAEASLHELRRPGGFELDYVRLRMGAESPRAGA